MSADRYLTRFAWLLPLALVAVVWFPITRNFFFFDDFIDLYHLRNDDAAHYLLRLHGGHMLIARNAVTAALDAAFGPDSGAFFAAVLLTHMLNAGLLYALLLALGTGWRVAALGSAFWGVAPINEGALGWFAAYGQVLTTTCILGVLVGLLHMARAPAVRWPAPLAFAALSLVGGITFGQGIAAALIMPSVAWLVLPPGQTRRRALLALAAAALAVVAIYAALRALEVPLFGRSISGIDVTLGGLRPAWLGHHLPLFGALLGFGMAALALGPPQPLTAFPTAAHAVAITVTALVLVAGLAAGRPAARRRQLACLLLVGSIYAIIAAARSLFTGVSGLLAFATILRYHYAPGALLVAALGAAVAAIAARWPMPPRLAGATVAALALGLVGWSIGTERRINHYDAERRETAAVLAQVRAAVAGAPRGATVEIPVRPFGPFDQISVATRCLFPGTAAVFAIYFPDDIADGRRVVFTSSDPLVLEGAAGGRRSAALIRALPGSPATDASDNPKTPRTCKPR